MLEISQCSAVGRLGPAGWAAHASASLSTRFQRGNVSLRVFTTRAAMEEEFISTEATEIITGAVKFGRLSVSYSDAIGY